MVENQYKTSASSTSSAMSLIKSRLDISNLLSTKKKPWRESAGVFYFKRSTKRRLNAKVKK